jgi:hypothetical protein
MPPHEDRIVARALAKLTKEAARTGRDLASLPDDAEVLPKSASSSTTRSRRSICCVTTCRRRP